MLTRVNRVLVTNTEGANTGTTRQSIINGDMLIVNKAGTVLTGTPTPISAEGNDTIYIAQGIGAGKGLDSLPIKLSNVTKVTVRGYVAPAEKVITFGYNGTSGTIPTPDASAEYALNINILDDQRIEGNRPTRQYYSYVTDATPTAKELALAFMAKVNNDSIPLNTNSYVIATVYTDTATFTALTNNATVTQYGKAISSTAHGVVAGDLVRIGGITASAPVYKVKSVIDANTFTIEGRYAGASGTVLAANIGVVTNDTVVGLRLTGKSIAYDGIDLYQKNNFIASLYNTSTTGFTVLVTPTDTTALNYGQGYWQQVRDQEYFAQGYFGITNRIQFPGSVNGQPATRAVVDNTYNSVVIEHYSEEETSLQKLEKYPLTTEVYFYSSSAPSASTKQTNFLATLESLVEFFGVRVQ